jgi:predicted Zn-dependent protease with MMP-like domain
MSYALTEEECVTAAQEALDSLPQWVRSKIGEVAVIVEDSHPDRLMGIYDPIGGVQRIVIFREANPTADEVRRTVWHEIGHYFGMNEEQLRKAGYG